MATATSNDAKQLGPVKTKPESSVSGSIRIVVQRYRSCRILLEEKEWVQVGDDNSEKDGVAAVRVDSEVKDPRPSSHCGMLVYISFASSAEKRKVEQAVTTLLNLPVLTVGLWGDGISASLGLLQLLSSAYTDNPKGHPYASVVVVPQANLICKVKSQGKSIQYHGQIDKCSGRELYDYFCNCLKGAILEHQYSCQNQTLPTWYGSWKAKHCGISATTASSSNPSISTPPDQIFRDESNYSSWDESGIPLADASGQPLSKSATKKLRKLLDAHRKKHLKWKEKHNDNKETNFPGTGTTTEKQPTATKECSIRETEPLHDRWSALFDHAFCTVVCGSFGRRQGLEMQSDMGPFCHLLEI